MTDFEPCIAVGDWPAAVTLALGAAGVGGSQGRASGGWKGCPGAQTCAWGWAKLGIPGAGAELRVLLCPGRQKKSREESSGEGSGVEILANRPYSDGPGGSGQYTHKVYHVGSHIPGWFRALLPKAALQVEEESWNAYPYTRTR